MTDTADKQNSKELFFRAHVFCCTNQRPDGHVRGSCANKGSVKLRDYMKVRAKELGLGDVRINSAGCLDRCEEGPAIVIYPEGVWYSAKTREDIDEILQKHLVEGGRARNLLMTNATGRDCADLSDNECENCGGC
ncbi:MAG: (2Fe-2S) ferredoxin domain-containing protein [Rhodospirillaceae bacterium]|nr:(2Fe-2S) ferredoxin domain-containing protein [Rhodospirillaceae bacterium]